jgi:hypothetical protein
MRKCDKIVRFGGRVPLVLHISRKMMKQVEIGKKGFLNLLNPVKIL